jgi:hypothetical protein
MEDTTFVQCCHAERRVFYCYTECRQTECRYAECYGAALRIKNSVLKSVVTYGVLSNTVFTQSKSSSKAVKSVPCRVVRP